MRQTNFYENNLFFLCYLLLSHSTFKILSTGDKGLNRLLMFTGINYFQLFKHVYHLSIAIVFFYHSTLLQLEPSLFKTTNSKNRINCSAIGSILLLVVLNCSAIGSILLLMNIKNSYT